jgi:Secretion system C-terminal sorting domain
VVSEEDNILWKWSKSIYNKIFAKVKVPFSYLSINNDRVYGFFDYPTEATPANPTRNRYYIGYDFVKGAVCFDCDGKATNPSTGQSMLAVDMYEKYGTNIYKTLVIKEQFTFYEGKEKGAELASLKPLETLMIPNNTELATIVFSGLSRAPQSFITDPQGREYSRSTFSTLATYMVTADSTTAMWRLYNPQAGNWRITVPESVETDSMEVFLTPAPRPFAITTTVQNRVVTVTWNATGASTTSTVSIYLDQNTSDFNGRFIGEVPERLGRFTYTLTDTLDGCSFYVYGKRFENYTMMQAYAPQLIPNAKPTLLPPTSIRTSFVPSLNKVRVGWTIIPQPNVDGYLVIAQNRQGIDSTFALIDNLAQTRVEFAMSSFATQTIRMVAFNDRGFQGCPSAMQPILQLLPRPIPTTPANSAFIDNAALRTGVTFGWQAVAGATRYRIQVSTTANFTQLAVPEIEASGTSIRLPSITRAGLYYWRVSVVNTNGDVDWSQIWTFTGQGMTTSVAADAPTLFTPLTYSLIGNTPNPFGERTTIEFDLYESAQVSLIVVDLLGREIATLVSERLAAGRYNKDFTTGTLPNGMYFYRLRVGNSTETRKMMIMR